MNIRHVKFTHLSPTLHNISNCQLRLIVRVDRMKLVASRREKYTLSFLVQYYLLGSSGSSYLWLRLPTVVNYETGGVFARGLARNVLCQPCC